jgi:eukaryotic-like serine/threonine-protein kinase
MAAFATLTSQARWDDAKRLFHAAMALAPAEREAYLRDACDGAPELLGEVQSLLAWADESGDFLETPLVRVADIPLGMPEHDPLLGQSLGPWRIVDIIGRGGMGVVYKAERADAAFKRPAAIKVVRRGGHSHDIIERFHRERETLAALDHPNIARVMDGGSTPDGEPYFVMEYVDGVPVDKYCDEQRLSLDERLTLFRIVCDAVQYAHQTLIVHRDIKPDNILVSRDGVPKLLDFGIARLLSAEGAAEDEAGTAATWLMTPEYASPEQMHGRAVTTATDVYSLGVLLHVLLTGLRPYRLTGTTQAALRDQLATARLMPPSARLRAEGDAIRDLAEARATSPRRLIARLAGDLDAIVLRALNRDLSQRYPTVEQLADDVDRHRTRYPVAARGHDVPYVARTFVRRHAVAFSVATAGLMLVAAGVAAVLWQASIAEDAQARAERRFEDVRRLAHVFMFDVHDEIVNVPGTTRARALMVRTASEYLGGLAREAAGDLGLQRELAAAFVKVGDAQGNPTGSNIGDTGGARASYERAIEIANTIMTAAPGDADAERTLALAHRRLADVLAFSGDTATALAHSELSNRLFAHAAGRADATREDLFQAAVGFIKLGDLLGNPNLPNLGRRADARVHYERALRDLQALDAAQAGEQRVRRYLGIVFERIGTLHEYDQDWPAATRAYQDSFAIREALAVATPIHTDIQRDYAIAYEKLGNVLFFTSNVDAAVVNYRGALAQFERLAQVDPSNAGAARTLAVSREKLARALLARHEHAEAIEMLRVALEMVHDLAARDAGNAQAPCDVARLAESLGDVHATVRQNGSHASACRYWRESLDTRRRLKSAGIACATDEAVARVSERLRDCR